MATSVQYRPWSHMSLFHLLTCQLLTFQPALQYPLHSCVSRSDDIFFPIWPADIRRILDTTRQQSTPLATSIVGFKLELQCQYKACDVAFICFVLRFILPKPFVSDLASCAMQFVQRLLPSCSSSTALHYMLTSKQTDKLDYSYSPEITYRIEWAHTCRR